MQILYGNRSQVAALVLKYLDRSYSPLLCLPHIFHATFSYTNHTGTINSEPIQVAYRRQDPKCYHNVRTEELLPVFQFPLSESGYIEIYSTDLLKYL